MKNSSGAVHFLYATAPGRLLLKGILWSHVDKIFVRFLRSRCSAPVVGWYARKNGIDLTGKYATFQDFFARTRPDFPVDQDPGHLISPCDGWLSAYPIGPDSSFAIKGSRYALSDLLQDEALAKSYHGGDCLIFRLCPSDYHHYSYIDDGFVGQNHFIPGVLHSVQPIACETYPVYTLNRRSWALLETDHFGPVVQTEVGALVVGGIVNDHENTRFSKGGEKGHFELAGSTIVLLFERGRMELLPALRDALQNQSELQVKQGAWIGQWKTHHP